MKAAQLKISSSTKKIIFWCCAYTVLVQALTLFVLTTGSHITVDVSDLEQVSNVAPVADTHIVDSIRI